MTEEEFKTEMAALESNFEAAKRQLLLKFGLSRAQFKKGDIIKSGEDILLIDRITVNVNFGLPEPVYRGALLKKDLTPRKNGATSAIFGNRAELVKKGE